MSQAILMLGAFPPEIGELREKLEGRVWRGATLEFLECGVGNLQAALNLQERLLSSEGPAVGEIIFIGSAGLYGTTEPKMEPGFSRFFHQIEISVLENRARIPDLLPSRIDSAEGELGLFLQAGLNGLEGAVNSPDSITLEEINSELFTPYSRLENQPWFENMEAFGLASVAARRNVPYCAFLALTNRVCREGSAAWARNFRNMGLDLQNAILSLVGPEL